MIKKFKEEYSLDKVKEARKDWKLEFYPHLTFAEEDAINYAINFIENKKAVTLFENADDTDTLLLRLSAVIEDPLIPGETVVFLDEVQNNKIENPVYSKHDF